MIIIQQQQLLLPVLLLDLQMDDDYDYLLPLYSVVVVVVVVDVVMLLLVDDFVYIMMFQKKRDIEMDCPPVDLEMPVDSELNKVEWIEFGIWYRKLKKKWWIKNILMSLDVESLSSSLQWLLCRLWLLGALLRRSSRSRLK